MLKKDQFQWTEESKVAFEILKAAMCQALVLALSNFTKGFCLETYASSKGIGAILSQEGIPVTYLSKDLGPKQMDLSIYEKEYLVILMAISKWMHYLEEGSFIIKTDHEALKHLLEHKLTTSIQKKGLTKLLGLNYVIQYRKCRHNLAADALSRRDKNEGELRQLTTIVIIPTWVQEVEQSYQNDLVAIEMITQLAVFVQDTTEWTYSKGVLRNRDLYGYTPPTMTWSTDSRVADIQKLLQERDTMNTILYEQLDKAQQRMKHYTDKKRSDRVLQVGDEVYLKLQQYKQSSVALRKNLKLSARYYGPYKVIEKIGLVAYKLQLLENSRIHYVFHISLLKRKIGEKVVTSRDPLEVNAEGQLRVYPLLVLDKRIVRRNKTSVTQLLIQWVNFRPENATWEDFNVLKS
ncbi:uncharacterized protein LOC120217297 [Hibiscus syriacus]|uniref:uncharacterized protein LOC120217297 n=1 Tax=Hibiscus syriacus TaxID=106335 RepID=UPI00192161A7|nr:uncharacterized protein LOC120217297 [Hibiscus syriacus]